MKKVKTIVLLVAVLLTGLSSFANEVKPATEIKLLGTAIEAHTVFQVKMNNLEQDVYTIRITDGKGNFLYKEELKGTEITRKYAFENAEVTETPVKVEITSKNTGLTEVYELAWVVTNYENFEVKKLK